MNYTEFTGKTVRDAIAKACEKLNVEEALLEVYVLEESARGFLGLVGHRNARVRVRRRDILNEVLELEGSETQELTSIPTVSPDRQIQSFSTPKVVMDRVEASSEEPQDIDPEKSRIVTQAKALLEGILIRIPVEASVQSSVSSGSVLLDITGDKSGLLIGKRGQTLDSLQYILNKALNRESSLEDKTEIIVDNEDYRRRKHESLRDMAVKMSQKAKKSLKPVAFNPMPANERRIIHLILAEDKEVYTKSYGEGLLRRIIVYPRKAIANKRRRR